MSSNEKLEINEKIPSFILNAPKFKFKKPVVTPTPFSLNDSDSEDELESSTVGNISIDEECYEGVVNFQNDDKTNFTNITLKFKRSLKQ
jgi:hypothetical protein